MEAKAEEAAAAGIKKVVVEAVGRAQAGAEGAAKVPVGAVDLGAAAGVVKVQAVVEGAAKVPVVGGPEAVAAAADREVLREAVVAVVVAVAPPDRVEARVEEARVEGARAAAAVAARLEAAATDNLQWPADAPAPAGTRRPTFPPLSTVLPGQPCLV